MRWTNKQSRTLTSELLLLLAAFIWGTTFVAQRQAMVHLGPLTYNGFRFGLGGLTLLVVRALYPRRPHLFSAGETHDLFVSGLLVGLALFAGATLQQMGMVTSTAGKGGFITGLYVVLVPLLGRLIGHRITISIAVGAILAVVGLYLLCVTESFSLERGDTLVLAGTFFWAVHVLLVGHYARMTDLFSLAMMQCFVCSLLSFMTAIVVESISLAGVVGATIPILYGGFLSAALAFSLQVYGQRTCPAAPAAIIMSMETVFAALAGWVVLGEHLTSRNLVGCGFMLAGMLLVQLIPPTHPKP